ncbi:MAG: peptide ABC transporter substrate-binding protein [Clostridia bacterium]|nr:peptide ABC transporter substrate-binding protein [Clostridia bacterium]
MKRHLVLVLILLLAVSLLAGCGNSSSEAAPSEEPEEEAAEEEAAEPETVEGSTGDHKVIRVGHAYDATSLDQLEVDDDGSYGIMMQTGEGLVTGYGGEIHPGIAESWEVNEDATVYTFHLRESKWADGSPLTAQDFVYTIHRALDPEAARQKADSFYGILNGEEANTGRASMDEIGVEAPDDYTLVITLKEPDSSFLYRVSSFEWQPQNQAKCEAEGAAYGTEADKVLTNGPFTCTEWAHESQLVLEKNPHYWNAENVKIDELDFIVGASDDVAKDMFLAGNLDVVDIYSNANVEILKERLDYFTYNSTYYFAHLNCAGHDAEAGRFMGNVNFRKAISCAISREAILSVANVPGTASTRIAAPSLVTLNGKSWDEEYPLTGWAAGQEPEKAQEYLNQALEELGATIEDVPVLEMLCFDSQGNLDKYQAMQDMLKQVLGIETKINPQPIQQMLEMADNGEFDFWLGGKMMQTPDWIDEVGYEYDSTVQSAISHYENQEYNQLRAQALAASNAEEREELAYQMEQILVGDMPTLLLYWADSYVMYVPGLKGVEEANGRGLYLANAYYTD